MQHSSSLAHSIIGVSNVPLFYICVAFHIISSVEYCRYFAYGIKKWQARFLFINNVIHQRYEAKKNSSKVLSHLQHGKYEKF
jgi:hypothetical protein